LPDVRVTDSDLEKMLKDTRVISITTYRRVVGAVSKASDVIKTDLVSAAEKLIHTQKTIHPSEQEAVDYLKKKLEAA